jgi:hypothetical protein
MSNKDDIAVPYIKSVTGACDGAGESITLTVEAKNGARLDVAMTPADLGKAISFMLDLAQYAAKRNQGPARKPGDMLTGTPVGVSHIGVAPGRRRGEALLAVAVGPMTLMFAAERAQLAAICRDLEHGLAPPAGHKPH